MGVGARLLIIESDAVFGERLRRAFCAAGYSVTSANTGRAGLRALYREHPHLVILGCPLLDVDSLTVLTRMREAADLPVLVAATKVRRGHCLRALELGAQDYFSRSLDPEELILRVEAALRRATAQGERPQVYNDGSLRVDSWRRQVTLNGRPVLLTSAEMSLLACLVRCPGRTVGYDELYSELPWLHGEGSDCALRSLVHRLRRKLHQPQASGGRIVSHRASGLSLEAPAPVAVGGGE